MNDWKTKLTFLLALTFLFLFSGSVYGEDEIYYCAETAANGFSPDEKWNLINTNLRNGHRGLPKGNSLLRLLLEKGLRVKKENLTEGKIIKLLRAYHKEYGKWASIKSEMIDGVDETWIGINIALVTGGRGLKGGLSLAKLRKKYKLK